METLKTQLPRWLVSHDLPMDKAFRCLNPNHPDRHPSMRYDRRRNTVHCFACGCTYDLIDLIGIEYNLETFPERLAKARELYGSQTLPTVQVKVPVKNKKKEDFSSYREGKGCFAPFFAARGLSEQTVMRYGLRAEKGYAVLPVFEQGRCVSVCRRALDEDAAVRYRNSVGEMRLWNADVVTQSQVIFVTEGIFDALSLIECGVQAVALCGAANDRRLAAHLMSMEDDQKPALIAAGDGDDAGQRLNARLQAVAKEQGLAFAVLAIPEGCKDANEWLLADRNGLAAACKELEGDVLSQTAAQKTQMSTESTESGQILSVTQFWGEDVDDVHQSEGAVKMNETAVLEDAFFAFLARRRELPVLSTGIGGLDALLGGGVPAGLTVLGAKSSVGKTTLMLQLADRFAAQGREVLFFTVEMSRFELLAKSLARLAQRKGATETTVDILNGRVGESRLRQLLVEYRASTGSRVHFVEPDEPLTPSRMLRITKEFAQEQGRAPVILLDYLQLLAPERPTGTEKQKIDECVAALKQLARRYDTAVIAASSFNRDAYDGAADMKSFKESGLVEYSADLLLAMQQRDAAAQRGAKANTSVVRKGMEERRKLELLVLKNRFGAAGVAAPLDYLPAAERFCEPEPDRGEQSVTPARRILR